MAKAVIPALFSAADAQPAHQTAFLPLKYVGGDRPLWRFGNNLVSVSSTFAGKYRCSAPSYAAAATFEFTARGSGRPACRLPTTAFAVANTSVAGNFAQRFGMAGAPRISMRTSGTPNTSRGGACRVTRRWR